MGVNERKAACNAQTTASAARNSTDLSLVGNITLKIVISILGAVRGSA